MAENNSIEIENNITEIQKLKTNIWITFKSRIWAEKRYRNYESMGFFIIQSFCMLLIFTSIFSDKIKVSYPYLDSVNIYLSIVVFSSSLVLWGAKFSETASKHRDCYLDLQNLNNTIGKSSNILSASYNYDQILRKYPNHKDIDYQNFLVESIIFSRQRVTSGNGHNINLTFIMCFNVFIRKIVWKTLILIGISAILLPILLVVN